MALGSGIPLWVGFGCIGIFRTKTRVRVYNVQIVQCELCKVLSPLAAYHMRFTDVQRQDETAGTAGTAGTAEDSLVHGPRTP